MEESEEMGGERKEAEVKVQLVPLLPTGLCYRVVHDLFQCTHTHTHRGQLVDCEEIFTEFNKSLIRIGDCTFEFNVNI